MATKTKRIFLFSLLPIFVLSTAMSCGKEFYLGGIPELEGARAVFSITPQKDVYKVGDTVWFSVRAEKELWGNWPAFESAEFRLWYPGVLSVPYGDASIVRLPDLYRGGLDPNLVDGKWLYEEAVAYKLAEAKTYVLDLTKYRSLDNTPYKPARLLEVSYKDEKARTTYSTKVPVYLADGPGSITLKVEE